MGIAMHSRSSSDRESWLCHLSMHRRVDLVLEQWLGQLDSADSAASVSAESIAQTVKV